MIGPKFSWTVEKVARNAAIGLLSLAFCPIIDALRASFVGVWWKQAFIPTWSSGEDAAVSPPWHGFDSWRGKAVIAIDCRSRCVRFLLCKVLVVSLY